MCLFVCLPVSQRLRVVSGLTLCGPRTENGKCEERRGAWPEIAFSVIARIPQRTPSATWNASVFMPPELNFSSIYERCCISIKPLRSFASPSRVVSFLLVFNLSAFLANNTNAKHGDRPESTRSINQTINQKIQSPSIAGGCGINKQRKLVAREWLECRTLRTQDSHSLTPIAENCKSPVQYSSVQFSWVWFGSA